MSSTLQQNSAPPVRLFGWSIAFGAATVLTLAIPTQHHLFQRAIAAIAEREGQTALPVTPWTQFFLLELPIWYLWLLIFIPVVWFCRRFPLTGDRALRNALAHLPLGVLAVVVHVTITTAVRLLYAPLPPGYGFGDVLTVSLIRYMVTLLMFYFAGVAIYHAGTLYVAYQSRALHASQLQTRLARAQLDVLKMQLHPHFLFNTLNGIASLMYRDISAAHGMIVRLSELLRLSLENSASHEVPLREELRFLEKYVDIQRRRFPDRLCVRYAIEPGAEPVLVPRLMLQPLVENAVRHGISERAGPGRIEVHAVLRNGCLALRVLDDGPGMVGPLAEEDASDGTGIGLQNTRARLQQLYGEAHTFELQNVEPHGLAVCIEIPARTRNASSAAEA